MSLYIRETRVERRSAVAKFVNIFLGMAAGVLVAAFAAYALQLLH
jgi:hypothetical protein